jgi:hypothetical protein
MNLRLIHSDIGIEEYMGWLIAKVEDHGFMLVGIPEARSNIGHSCYMLISAACIEKSDTRMLRDTTYRRPPHLGLHRPTSGSFALDLSSPHNVVGFRSWNLEGIF